MEGAQEVFLLRTYPQFCFQLNLQLKVAHNICTVRERTDFRFEIQTVKLNLCPTIKYLTHD
jgi:hypothetical protein